LGSVQLFSSKNKAQRYGPHKYTLFFYISSKCSSQHN
jgi:hypothetical protein